VNRVFKTKDIEVQWLGGALFVQSGSHTLLVDCPPGVEHYLEDRAGLIDTVVLTSGRSQAVGGLIGLLATINRYAKGARAVSVCGCVGEERGPALLECWLRDWDNALELHVDLTIPGSILELGGLTLRSWGVTHGEPIWSLNKVKPAVGVAIEINTGSTKVVWIPGAAPHPLLSRLCQGASLAVVEVGTSNWPSNSQSWRLTEEEAKRVSTSSRVVWLVDDEGRRLNSGRA
jgi:hypothetical protein